MTQPKSPELQDIERRLKNGEKVSLGEYFDTPEGKKRFQWAEEFENKPSKEPEEQDWYHRIELR